MTFSAETSSQTTRGGITGAFESREPQRRPFLNYRSFIKDHYDGLPGALTAVTGFITGLPAGLIAATSLAAMIWLDPMTGIWLAITAIAAIGGFITGTLRKPHPALYRMTSRDDGHPRIAHLENQLADASARERALLTALTAVHDPRPDTALPAPAIRGQVTG